MKWELDAARASAAQAVEHYETARYTTLVNASELGMEDVESLLSQTLAQDCEKRIKRLLPLRASSGLMQRNKRSGLIYLIATSVRRIGRFAALSPLRIRAGSTRAFGWTCAERPESTRTSPAA
jgi:hypothetical protein